MTGLSWKVSHRTLSLRKSSCSRRGRFLHAVCTRHKTFNLAAWTSLLAPEQGEAEEAIPLGTDRDHE